MDIRQLRTFMEVAKLGSFSKAAEKLYLTQPTVTNHIQVIERELQTVLLNRMSKGITLTEAGNIVYQNSLDIINTYESMKYQLDEHKGRIEGKLEIASSSVPRKHLLPELIFGFQKQHPLVTFSILDVDSSKVVENILDGYIDFGFVGAIYEDPNLEYIPIMNDYLVFATPANVYKDRPQLSNLSINEVIKQPLILREEGSGTGKILKDSLLNEKIAMDKLHISAYVADTETIKKMVSLGTGSTFLSYKDAFDSSEKKTIEGNVFKVEELSLYRNFYIVFHKKRKLSPLGEAFKDFTLSNSK
ncbi:selenium metabolism-associated LysR family transcriptional regulator [Gudongella sp. DL1XJH-153]|uniref:selenium metabolism-associated LysR family transcriptional regulator n=1 Tax=Gudongella sp. DL1XJH-153 TaxID=3409804 RepID=UPI003BB69B08